MSYFHPYLKGAMLHPLLPPPPKPRAEAWAYGGLFKGGHTIQIARITPQIARIDRFSARVNFSHAGNFLEILSNIRNRESNGGFWGMLE